jgi:hypothetical protein
MQPLNPKPAKIDANLYDVGSLLAIQLGIELPSYSVVHIGRFILKYLFRQLQNKWRTRLTYYLRKVRCPS